MILIKLLPLFELLLKALIIVLNNISYNLVLSLMSKRVFIASKCSNVLREVALLKASYKPAAASNVYPLAAHAETT
jgi:hypothetical protein